MTTSSYDWDEPTDTTDPWADDDAETAELQAENARLRAEVEALKTPQADSEVEPDAIEQAEPPEQDNESAPLADALANARTLDEAANAVVAARQAAQPTQPPQERATPAEVQAAIDDAEANATDINDYVRRLTDGPR